MPGDDGIAMDEVTDLGGWDILDGMLSAAGSGVSVGLAERTKCEVKATGNEGDQREGERPEKSLGDSVRGGASVNIKSVVILGRLRGEVAEQGGGARRCRLLGWRLADSPDQVEGAVLAMEQRLAGAAMTGGRDPARLGPGDVVGVDSRFGDGRGNKSYSFSYSSSSSSRMRSVGGFLQLGEGGAQASAVDEPDAAVRREEDQRCPTFFHGFHAVDVSRLVADGPISLEHRRLPISFTLIETPRTP